MLSQEKVMYLVLQYDMGNFMFLMQTQVCLYFWEQRGLPCSDGSEERHSDARGMQSTAPVEADPPVCCPEESLHHSPEIWKEDELGKIQVARKMVLSQREVEGAEAGVSGEIKGARVGWGCLAEHRLHLRLPTIQNKPIKGNWQELNVQVMQRPGALCFASWTTGTGVLCLTFFQLADSESDCELGERCIGQSDENFSSWYVWFLMLFFLALLLSCGICCCLRCWLKRRSCLPHRRTLAVFALSSSDAFCASEVPQCPFAGSPSPCMTVEMSSPAPQFSLGGTDLPPSYEDIMNENKL
ncbi:transmembrane protein 207 [Accipiter gentilis]|uniref:transmembrane protein 207 n=1 Tax=Astur gentilis TaxID=8957 RepID=UPI00210FF184|nr:transmembrane protein 207 [Accipiter gentilis]